jgi:hypothetical protein
LRLPVKNICKGTPDPAIQAGYSTPSILVQARCHLKSSFNYTAFSSIIGQLVIGMPPSTRRRAQRHLPPPPAEFSDSEDLEEEELHPEQDDDDVGDDMAVIEGEEDLDDDGLGKSYLVLRRSCFVSRYATFTCPCTSGVVCIGTRFRLESPPPSTRYKHLGWLPEPNSYSLLHAGIPSSVSSVDRIDRWPRDDTSKS